MKLMNDMCWGWTFLKTLLNNLWIYIKVLFNYKKNKLKCKINHLYFKLYFTKIKIVNFFRIYKLKFETKKFAYAYILIFFINILLSIIISNFINISFDNHIKSLFIDTGISLIGLSGIVFTLQIFNQETRNTYTNSVMEKILDIKFQHIIEYVYIISITFFFLLIPQFKVFEYRIDIFLPFFYLSIIGIFIMLGIDLFVSSNLSNKYRLIIVIEKRINYILDMVEKEYLELDKYSKKRKSYNPSLNEYINKWNVIFIVYIQCINTLLRTSVNDSILFENGMDSYIKIIKNRLLKRKNKFEYIDIPFFNDIIPKNDNDNFIEKYMLEYLNEYSQIALANKNRDILQAVQNTYHKILLSGKENRYKNADKLELTMIVTFSYYLDVVKMIVQINNDNMLIDTVEVFKDLFITNKEYFYDLVNDFLGDFVSDSFDLALENKSLMNFRNLLEIAIIPLDCVLYSKDPYNYSKIEMILNCIKNAIIEFTNQKGLIRQRDGAKLYLKYIFNLAEKNSLYNYLVSYYKNNVDKNDKYIDTSEKVCRIFTQFIEFYTSEEIVICLDIMEKDNRLVTGFVDYKYILSCFVSMLVKMIDYNEFDNENNQLQNLLNKIFYAINKIAMRHESIGMRICEIDDFYIECLRFNINYELRNNEEIKKIYFFSYLSSLISVYDESIKYRSKIENYYVFIDLVYKFCDDDNYIIDLLDWYYEKVNISLVNIISEYKKFSLFPFTVSDKISYENREQLKLLILKKIESKIKDCDDDEIILIANKNDINISHKKSKKSRIKEILNSIKNVS